MERISGHNIPFAGKKFLAGKITAGRVYPEFFPLVPEDEVVNIGCGLGPQAAAYRNRYARMVGVDVNAARLASSMPVLAASYGVRGYETVCADVEDIPLPSASFDKAIAVDIAEHVRSPERMLAEAYRLLKPEGFLLVTFPAMHDKYGRLLSFFRPRRPVPVSAAWNPDAHNREFPLDEWVAITEAAGFSFVRSRATTMFPPFHLWGVPRFWFSNGIIHAIDRFFCGIPFVKRFGQTLMCVFKK